MDGRSFRIANILVGNDVNDAGLEITIFGPTLEFTEDSLFALTGGDLSPSLNGTSIEMYRALPALKGDVLSFGQLKSGCRSYLAVAGGIDVQPVMGSRSTLLRGEIGGFNGRKLKSGDYIPSGRPKTLINDFFTRSVEKEDFSGKETTVRVLMGPQDDRFTQHGIDTLLHATYRVGKDFDRMGYRLNGAPIEHVSDANIISDGIALGSIQVPGNGQPIIMMADRQSTGGYTKIANVITVDLPKIAQLKADDAVSFRKVDIRAAHELYRHEFAWYSELRERLDKNSQAQIYEKSYRICVNKKYYFVSVKPQ